MILVRLVLYLDSDCPSNGFSVHRPVGETQSLIASFFVEHDGSVACLLGPVYARRWVPYKHVGSIPVFTIKFFPSSS